MTKHDSPPEMGVIEVITPGMLTTVQDLGRWGWQRFGVAVGGAMDQQSLRLANWLVGNDERAAGLELTLCGGRFRLPAGAMVSVVGADLNPQWQCATGTLLPFPQGRAVQIEEEGELLFGAARVGTRAYLAVRGGIDLPQVMQSRSTDLRGQFGGWHGRSLQAGDRLPIGTEEIMSESRSSLTSTTSATRAVTRVFRSDSPRTAGLCFSRRFLRSPTLKPLMQRTAAEPVMLRMIRGEEFASLSSASQQAFWKESFVITPQSDRMGYRLAGPELTLTTSQQLLSAGIVRGTVQLPAGGQPLLIMADGAPTGGYPRLGHVISADWSLAGQLSPGDRFCFGEVSWEEGRQLARQADRDFHHQLQLFACAERS